MVDDIIKTIANYDGNDSFSDIKVSYDPKVWYIT